MWLNNSIYMPEVQKNDFGNGNESTAEENLNKRNAGAHVEEG